MQLIGCGCRGFRVGSPPETFDHSPFEYNGRLLRTMSHESRFFRHGFFSDSDAAFRRDRLRMVLRPCITGHKFRLYPGFRRARPLQRSVSASVLPFLTVMTGRAEKARASPYKSHTGDKNYAAHSCSCRGFRVGSPPAIFDHSPVEYNGRLLRTANCDRRGR